MKDLLEDKDDDLKLPNDIPKDFLGIVFKVLDFIENVDKTKNKNK